MRCYKSDDGRSAIFRAREHIRRLIRLRPHRRDGRFRSAQEELLKACADVVRINKFAECYMRPLVFLWRRRDGTVGARQQNSRVDRRMAMGRVSRPGRRRQGRAAQDLVLRAIPSQLADAARRRPPGHYVNSILAGYEARRNGYDEALLLDVRWLRRRGQRRERSSSCATASCSTPPLNSVLAGITRDAVMKILQRQRCRSARGDLSRATRSTSPTKPS